MSFAQCWEKISIASKHTVALKANGSLWAWGDNQFGQLGNGTNLDLAIPTQIGNEYNWAQIATGAYDSVAIKNDGTLWSWGRNNYGQLGDGTFTNRNTPQQIGTDSNWVSVSGAGSAYHYAALKADGTLWTWGYNLRGQIGDGTMVDKNVPTQIGDGNWLRVFAGGYVTMGIKTDNTLWVWGDNSLGQLGIGSGNYQTSPYQLGTAIDWAMISIGGYYTLATKTNGTLWGWGNNTYSQLTNSAPSGDVETPVQIGTQNDWNKIAAGGRNSLAVKQDGTLWSWGYNNNGQVGDGTTINRPSPVQIGSNTNWLDVYSSGYHSGAVTTNIDYYSWGLNDDGQIGDNTLVNKLVPTLITCTALSTEDIIQNNELMLYPNPAANLLTIKSSSLIDNVVLLNALGEIIPIQKTNDQLDVSHLSKGLYILEIVSGSKKIYKKFLKQ